MKKLSPKLCRELLGLNRGLEFDEKGNLKTFFYPMVGRSLWAEELLNELSPKSQEKYRRLEEEVAQKQDQLMSQMFEYRENAGKNRRFTKAYQSIFKDFEPLFRRLGVKILAPSESPEGSQ